MAEFDRKNYSFIFRDYEQYPPTNFWERGALRFFNWVVNPMIQLKKNIIEPNQKTYYWYHQKYPRVPTIDQCYEYDVICHFEAEEQLYRDQKVENAIMGILMERFDDCMYYEGNQRVERCTDLWNSYLESETNYFIKYGDVGNGADFARRIFMKQKHRLLWERRHGPVGTGKKQRHYKPDGTPYYK